MELEVPEHHYPRELSRFNGYGMPIRPTQPQARKRHKGQEVEFWTLSGILVRGSRWVWYVAVIGGFASST